MAKYFLSGLIFLSSIFSVTALQSQTIEINFWHSMAGSLGVELNLLVDGFNKSQDEFSIRPIYKGDYIESLTSFAAAFHAKKPPDLIQVFEIGKEAMTQPAGVVESLSAFSTSLPESSFFPAIHSFYSVDNKLVAMPFNVSVPVMFYNVDALAKIGYSSDDFPKTWQEMDIVVKKLKDYGYNCAYTTANPAWILLESYSALNGIPMFSPDTGKSLYNNKSVINYLKRIRNWENQGYFRYGGRIDNATVHFVGGECPIFSQSSGAYGGLSSMVTFKLGMAPIPIDADVTSIRHNNVVGGAALWASSGLSIEKYRGIAYFYEFLSKPDNQLQWHEKTGYLPLGLEGDYELIAKYSKHPVLAIGLIDFSQKNINNFNVSVGPLNQIRSINDQALEAIFSGMKTPEEAMDEAVKRSNHAIMRFNKNTK